MKRMDLDSLVTTRDNQKMKKVKEIGLTNLDENLLFEVLKHRDARTLVRTIYFNKLWHKMAQDERLWKYEVHLSLSLLFIRYHEMMTVRDLTKQ
ncbi:hypothetical protein CUMW_226210 [Citrus unshiu]|uniref:F-box domain-containing protein n=1 Tax=Citrus unshiu TaxID=55188 RepID=A0A2H5QG04_CITUN|nr:hypothetical protein CUMW_226210 [Citrus unshiu]